MRGLNPAWDPKNPVAPFTPDGSLQHYPESTWRDGANHEPEWRDVRPWEATLTLVDYARGRSAAYFLLQDAEGHQFPMMLTDVTALLMARPAPVPGEFSGLWTIRKRGQNYGIQAIASSDKVTVHIGCEGNEYLEMNEAHGRPVEMDAELHDRWRAAARAYDAVQQEIKDLYQKAVAR